jgi:multidrug efflux pump subunit AcrA (membrane-fusion protein)
VHRILVDEGQMVAEGDDVVVLESAGQLVTVATDVSGVVRELHVGVNDAVHAGDLIALIDES